MIEYGYNVSGGVVSLAQVHTVVHKVDPLYPDKEIIARCAEVVQRGGLVAFPTETVYGLGASALNPEAVSRVFKAKARPRDNPLIVHISRLDGIKRLVTNISPKAEALMKRFWPGPLTLLFPRSEIVLDIVTAGLPNVAVRMPDHPVSQMLIDACGVPLVAPSANQSGRPSPTCARDVLAELNGKVDIILDGGPTHIGVESTVLDVSGDTPVILRPGGITREEIEAALKARAGSVLVDGNGLGGCFGRNNGAPSTVKCRHYMPKADLYLATGTHVEQRQKIILHALRLALSGTRVAVLASEENSRFYLQLEQPAKGLLHVINLGSRSDLPLVAARLYSGMRRSEELGARVILSETFSLQGIGLAIANRLENASQGRKLPEFGWQDAVESQAGDAQDGEDVQFMSSKPLRVLMVCTGNTCRSPMAEGILRKSWKEAGEPYPIEVVSGGVATMPGLPASEEAVKAMKSMGVDISRHLSATISFDSLARADLVIAMTQDHKQMLLVRYPEFKQKILTLSEISPGIGGDVIDPFGKSQEEYDKTAKILEKSLTSLAKRLSGQEAV